MNKYKVEWAEYNKKTTEYKPEFDSEIVEADSEQEAIELAKQYIFDNTDHEEYPEIEITESGIDFGEFEYCRFKVKITMLNKLEIINGFYFLKGNYVEDIEGNNSENAVGLHWVNCEIEDYDKDGVFFDVDENLAAEIYIQEFDGQREYLLDFRE